MPKKYKGEVVEGDRYVLATYSLTHGISVLDSSNDLRELLGKLVDQYAEDSISVLEVVDCKWQRDARDPSEAIPRETRSLFEVEPQEALQDFEEY